MKANEFNAILDDLKRRRIPAAVKQAVVALLDKKAEKITVLKLKEVSQLTDYLIICQGNSSRQNQALADHVVKSLRNEIKIKPYGTEGERAAEWILVDYIDFIVNIFLPETREKYSLEKLWMDAKRYDFSMAG